MHLLHHGKTLLAYLVRRLLPENGANTLFVNRIADQTVQIEALIEDPIHEIQHTAQQAVLLERSTLPFLYLMMYYNPFVKIQLV